MAPGSNQVWCAMWDSDLGMYTPQRQIQRYTRADNQFKDRAMAQDRCDEMNNKYTKPTPLQLIPDKTITKP